MFGMFGRNLEWPNGRGGGGSEQSAVGRLFDFLMSGSSPQAEPRSLLSSNYHELLSGRELARLADSLTAAELGTMIGMPLIKIERRVSNDDRQAFIRDIGCEPYTHSIEKARAFAAKVESDRGVRRLNGSEYQDGHNDVIAKIATCNLMALGIGDPEELHLEYTGSGLHDLAEDMPKGIKPSRKKVLAALKREGEPFTAADLGKFYSLIEIRGRTGNSLAQALKLWEFGADIFVTTTEYRELLGRFHERPDDPMRRADVRIAYETFCNRFMDAGLIIAKFDGRTAEEMNTYCRHLFEPGKEVPQRRKTADVAANSKESALGVECFAKPETEINVDDFLLEPRETDLTKPEGLDFRVKVFKVAFNRGIENVEFYRDNFSDIWQKGVISDELWVTQHYWDTLRLQPALVRAARYLVFTDEGKKILKASRDVATRKYEEAVIAHGGPDSPKSAQVPEPVFLSHLVAKFLSLVPGELGTSESLDTAGEVVNGNVILAMIGDTDINRTKNDEAYFLKRLAAYENRVEASGRSNPGILRRYVLKKNAEYEASLRQDNKGGLDAAAS